MSDEKCMHGFPLKLPPEVACVFCVINKWEKLTRAAVESFDTATVSLLPRILPREFEPVCEAMENLRKMLP